MQEIPIRALPRQEFNVLLDDQQCTILLYQRGLYMYMDLTVNGELVTAGAICLDGANLVQYPTTKFKVSLHFADSLGTDPPQYAELNTRFFLLYLSEDEEKPEWMKY